jgi:hypothetical protein
MPRSAQKKYAPAVIKPMTPVKPPVPAQQNSMLSTVKEGFSFGVGSAIAHRVVGGLFGLGSGSPGPQPPQPPIRNIEYEQCLAEHTNVVDGTAFCAYLLTK